MISACDHRRTPIMNPKSREQGDQNDRVDRARAARPSPVCRAILLTQILHILRRTQSMMRESGHRRTSHTGMRACIRLRSRSPASPQPGSRLGNTSSRDRASSSRRVMHAGEQCIPLHRMIETVRRCEPQVDTETPCQGRDQARLPLHDLPPQIVVQLFVGTQFEQRIVTHTGYTCGLSARLCGASILGSRTARSDLRRGRRT